MPDITSTATTEILRSSGPNDPRFVYANNIHTGTTYTVTPHEPTPSTERPTR